MSFTRPSPLRSSLARLRGCRFVKLNIGCRPVHCVDNAPTDHLKTAQPRFRTVTETFLDRMMLSASSAGTPSISL